MATPTIVIVGADKGGVGKTLICRALLDYFASANKDYRAFDTQSPLGNLKRFFPVAEIVDLKKSDDQMKVFDNLSRSSMTVIDIEAGLLSPSLQTLTDIGFMDLMREGKLNIMVFHVVGSTISSLNEIKTTSKAMEGAKHFVVKNHTNDSVFFEGIDGVSKDMFNNEIILDIPKLDERAAEYVEASAQPFQTFMNDDSQSLVLRGKVKHWLGLVFKQFNMIKLD
jgi:dethiobiotin synthetase